mgnify:CR=1 FL=1
MLLTHRRGQPNDSLHCDEAAPAASGNVGRCLLTSVGAESPGAHQAAAASQGGPGSPALGGACVRRVAASGGFAEANASAQCLTKLATDEPGPGQSIGLRFSPHPCGTEARSGSKR